MFNATTHLQKVLFFTQFIICCYLSFTLSGCGNEAPENVPIKVVLEEGTNMAAAVSPDGKSLVMDVQGSLWSLPIEGGKATYLAGKMWGCHLPTYSPDGQFVAFHAYKDGNFHIYLIKTDGSGLQQLTEGPFDHREPHWSPNGRRMIFSTDRGGTYDIWQIEVKSKELTQLTDGSGNEFYPTYSPDGSKIAYLEQGRGVYVMGNSETSELIMETSGELGGPSWSPSGSKILVSEVAAATTLQYVVDVEIKNIDTLTSKDVDIFPFRAHWLSEDEIVYTADGKLKRRQLSEENVQNIPFQAEVELFRPTYTRRTYDFDDATSKVVKGVRSPVLSPDGKRVAFSALGDIWIQDIEGELHQMTEDVYVDIDPDWSADGKQLLFSSDRLGSMDIWCLDLEKDSVFLVHKTPADAIYASWSPDGTKVAYNETSNLNVWGNASLKLLDIESESVKDVHPPIFVPGQISWTPDGEFMALAALEKYSSRFREGTSKILLIASKDLKSEYLVPLENKSLAMRGKNGPKWAPDGKSILFVHGGRLWQQQVNEDYLLLDEPQPLTNELAESPSWSRDGKTVLYRAADELRLLNMEDGETKVIPINLKWEKEMPAEKYVIHIGRYFDGLNDTYHENMDIVVEGHRIVSISPHDTHAEGVEVLDASGQTLIPGLFDMHTHQSAVCGEDLGRNWLAFGITTAREVGANPYDALERKESWESGQRPGPRLFYTGGLTDGSRIYYGLANGIQGPIHLQIELDRALKLEYDLIKTYVRMPDYMQQQITEFAHNFGIPVSSHELYPAVSYGVDAVEHLLGTSRRGYSLKQSRLQIPYQDVRSLLAASGMYITPTLALGGGMAPYAARNMDIFEHPAYLSITPANERALFEGYIFGRQKQNPEAQQQQLKWQQDFLGQLLQEGGNISAGTDVPFLPYGWGIHAEMQIYVDGGWTPFQALQSATYVAASSLNVQNDLGSVEEGKIADMVIVDGDPLKNIKDAWKVKWTIKNGKIFQVDELLSDSNE